MMPDDPPAFPFPADLEPADPQITGFEVPELSDARLDADQAGDSDSFVWRVGDESPALRIDLQAGTAHGLANRFDPFDFWDEEQIAPSALKINKIHFLVNPSGEPEGPMEWHIWEDNGGHKADAGRDIIDPIRIIGRPGENVIDLEALDIDAVIDPPRLFHVGVANKLSESESPDILLDDGLPFVGNSGDFHASVVGEAIGAGPENMHCGTEEWILLSPRIPGESTARSPAWMIWLEVEWVPSELGAELLFEEVASPNRSFGDFTSARRIAVADYDRDGFEDLLVNGRKLYRNAGPEGFLDVTDSVGIQDSGNGAVWADYDNDGDLDFYQFTPNCRPCGHDGNMDDLWRNEDGRFVQVREVDYAGDPNAPVPGDQFPSEAAAWGDFNGDGYLDLYVANHVDWDTGACYPDYLWLSTGPPDFAFADVSEALGLRDQLRCSRGVSPADYDRDGDLDIFVSNYRLNADTLWENLGNDSQGRPRFRDRAEDLGVAGRSKTGRFAGAYGHSIGAAWGDLDADGDSDLVSARLAHSAWLCFSDPSMIYESVGGPGNPRFEEIGDQAGLEYVETHSDASLADVDNDGRLDLYISQVYDGWRGSLYLNRTVITASLASPSPSPTQSATLTPEPSPSLTGISPSVTPSDEPTDEPRRTATAEPEATPTIGRPKQKLFLPLVILETGDGERALEAAELDRAEIRLENTSFRSGIWPRYGWGTAWSDLDSDGDLDFISQGIWFNRAVDITRRRSDWLQVELQGCGLSNRDAIGSSLELISAEGMRQYREVVGGRGTGSQDSLVQHFGLGLAGSAVQLKARFPSGQIQELYDLEINRRIAVTEIGAYIIPASYFIGAGEKLRLRADTCSAQRKLDWDLDGDGSFDDAEGPEVELVYDQPGQKQIRLRARGLGSAAGPVGISKIEIQVRGSGF